MNENPYLPYHATYTVREVENGLISHWQSSGDADEICVWRTRDEFGENIKNDIVSLLDAVESDGFGLMTRYKVTLTVERVDEEGGAV